jgi:proton-dependent oligopeptide transporter, POT family
MKSMEQFKAKSVKYPIMYMAIYLGVQMFLVYNIVLFSVNAVGESMHFGNALYSVVWAMGSILPIFVIKLSDKWGYKESLIVAGIFQTLGFFILSFATLPTLFIGASMYGTGMVFAVSQNYVVMSHTMERGYKGRFNVFLTSYVIMNLFAFAVALLSGLSSTIGYANVFRMGAVLSLCLLIFVLTLYNRAECVRGSLAWELANRPKAVKNKSFVKLFLVGIVTFVALYLFILIADIINIIIDISLVATILFLVYLCISKSGTARKKLITFTIVTIFSMVFWTGYNIYTATGFVNILDTVTNLHGLPVQWILSIDSLVIVLLGAIFALAMIQIEKRGVHLNGILRTIIGLFCLGLGMAVVVFGFHQNSFHGIDVYYMVLAIFCCAIGEIFIGSVSNALAGQCGSNGLDGLLISIGFIVVGGTAAFSVLLSDWMLNASKQTLLVESHQFSYVIGVFAIICILSAILLTLLYKKLTTLAGFTGFKTVVEKRALLEPFEKPITVRS